ncbi:MAG: rod shape-determining protein MreC [Sphingomonadaceae bacterium]|nr:rod shape-determining protein MreC [Sphingomonadaceae bacterium]
MAPPASRRSGHSRRAQYGIFTGYVIAAIGALAGAILLGISLWQPGSFSGLRNTAQDAVSPVGEAGAVARTESQGLFETVAGYFRAGSKNAQLRREVELTRIRLAEAEALKQENARLKELLSLTKGRQGTVAITRFIGSTASSTRRFGYIGAGRKDGVEAGMPVRSGRGIVGRVLEVGRTSSRVLLLTDSESVLPVRLAREDTVAFAEGRGDGLLRIRLINLGVNPLKVGDVFVTSGAGGIFEPGVAVAIVNEVTSDGAVARMISDPAATNYVTVERVWQPVALKAATVPAETPLAADDGGEAASQP